jgi:hypothetical protein
MSVRKAGDTKPLIVGLLLISLGWNASPIIKLLDDLLVRSELRQRQIDRFSLRLRSSFSSSSLPSHLPTFSL